MKNLKNKFAALLKFVIKQPYFKAYDEHANISSPDNGVFFCRANSATNRSFLDYKAYCCTTESGSMSTVSIPFKVNNSCQNCRTL